MAGFRGNDGEGRIGIIFRDASERKRLEDELQQLNKTLERRVAERTAHLEDAVADTALWMGGILGASASSALAVRLESNQQVLGAREEQLQDLVGKLLTAQEEERRRVAYEIHDGLAQVASAALQYLQAFAGRHRAGEFTRSREELDLALKLVRQTVEDARRVISDLRPITLDDFGLPIAIRQKVEGLRAEGWEITYDEGSLGDERLPEAVKTTLYRVAQEALNNVRKHAGTTRVHVGLRRRGTLVRLEIRDRGCGFRPAAPSVDGGAGERVGLSSMHERVALLGGELEIRIQPGIGTAIVAEVPLPEPMGEEDAERAGERLPARLVIADDHDLTRSGLRSVLEGEEDLEVVGEARNGREALELCRRVRPDAVLMDVRMPEMDGMAATRAIKKEHPRTGVVMLTMHEDPNYLYEALKAGAAGYVLKNSTQGELAQAVRKVLRGESPINQVVATQLLRRLATEGAERGEERPPDWQRRRAEGG